MVAETQLLIGQTIKMARRFDTLPALPGAADDGVRVLLEILQYLADQANPSRALLLQWLMDKHDIQERTATNALQGIERCGVILIRRDSSIMPTELGRQVLSAGEHDPLDVLATHFVEIFNGLAETLDILSKNNGSTFLDEIVEQRPASVPRSKIAAEIHWLIALGCVEYADARFSFRLTTLGRQVLKLYRADRAENPITAAEESVELEQVSLPNTNSELTPVETLINELNAASLASNDYRRLERCLAMIFRSLGFAVQEFGGKGDTDLVIEAKLGSGSYTVVVDAKSHQINRRADVESDNIAFHRDHRNATYAAVVARKFAQGRRLEEAKEQRVVFITTDCLIAWLRLHADTPLSPAVYEAVFQSPGLLERLPAEILNQAALMSRLVNLIKIIFAIFADAHEFHWTMSIPVEHVLRMANKRDREVAYQRVELDIVIQFLKSPLLDYLGENENGELYLRRHPEDVSSVLLPLIQQLTVIRSP